MLKVAKTLKPSTTRTLKVATALEIAQKMKEADLAPEICFLQGAKEFFSGGKKRQTLGVAKLRVVNRKIANEFSLKGIICQCHKCMLSRGEQCQCQKCRYALRKTAKAVPGKAIVALSHEDRKLKKTIELLKLKANRRR